MRRSVGFFLLVTLALVPFAWIVATSSFDEKPLASGIILAVCLLSYAFLYRALSFAHRRGRLLPNLCRTCGSPMAAIDPRALRPPSGTPAKALPRWRCKKCGRLV